MKTFLGTKIHLCSFFFVVFSLFISEAGAMLTTLKTPRLENTPSFFSLFPCLCLNMILHFIFFFLHLLLYRIAFICVAQIFTNVIRCKVHDIVIRLKNIINEMTKKNYCKLCNNEHRR